MRPRAGFTADICDAVDIRSQRHALPQLRKCCNAAGNLSNLADFLASHDRFLVYGGPRSAYMLKYFINAGATVAIEHMSKDDFLIFVTLTRKEISTTSSR
jgi:hypothetical protein